MSSRYTVKKASGSRLVHVVDNVECCVVKSFDIFKGQGDNNGWALADALCERLNQIEENPQRR